MWKFSEISAGTMRHLVTCSSPGWVDGTSLQFMEEMFPSIHGDAGGSCVSTLSILHTEYFDCTVCAQHRTAFQIVLTKIRACQGAWLRPDEDEATAQEPKAKFFNKVDKPLDLSSWQAGKQPDSLPDKVHRRPCGGVSSMFSTAPSDVDGMLRD